MSKILKFKSRLVAAGPEGSWCHLYFPFDVVKTFGTRARVPVAGTINGFKFRSSIMPMDGRHYMCINQKMQVGANAKSGDVAHFVMQRDDKPRTVALPAALKKMLAAKPRVKTVFVGLSYSHRKEYSDWIAQAKQTTTVQRRLKKLASVLLARKKSKA